MNNTALDTSFVDDDAMERHVVIEIHREEDAYFVAQQARKMSFELGFSDFDTGMVTIAAAEIATNVVRYALPGVATIQTIENDQGIEITIDDHGMGIADLEAAMVDGFSTHCEPSIGKGLGSASRCVEEFVVNKTDQSGTSITLRHYLPTVDDAFEKIGISFPAEGQEDNGDSYLFKPYQSNKLLMGVIDGAGMGKNAALASQLALGVVKANYSDELDVLVKKCHEALRNAYSERPVEMALLRILPETMEFCGIGNLGVRVCADTRVSFPIQDGSVGMILPRHIHVHTVKRPKNMTVYMHSDGVVLPEEIEINNSLSFERSACQFYDQTALMDDDATLLVLRDKTR